MARKTPSWRHRAAYSRPLTDADGLVTGREVCVFARDEDVLLVEGVLGAKTFDKAWFYKVLAEAVRAAEEWDGLKSPNGDWWDYKSRDNGDLVGMSEDPEALRSLREMAEVFESVGQKGISLADTLAKLEKAQSQQPVYGSATSQFTAPGSAAITHFASKYDEKLNERLAHELRLKRNEFRLKGIT